MSTRHIESLGSRLLLAGDLIQFPGGTAQIDNHNRLIVTTDTTSNHFTVRQTATRIFVADVLGDIDHSFANKGIRKIVVHLKDGDDLLELATHTPVLARGDFGNDTIIGGGENDDLFGDDGSDRILGGGGDDLIEGGAGADALYAGVGADTLHGDAGSDRLYSNEEKIDPADVLDGGKGTSVDRFFVSTDDTVARNRGDIIIATTNV